MRKEMTSIPVLYIFLTCYLLLASLRAKFGSKLYGRVGHFNLYLSTFKFLFFFNVMCPVRGLF